MNRCMPMTCCLVLMTLAAGVAGQETGSPEPPSEEAPPLAAGTPGFEVERFSWVGNVVAGCDATLEQCKPDVTVVNRFGTIRARFGGYQGQVEVFANVQHFAQEGPRLVVETRETRTGVEVTVGYGNGETAELVTVRDPDHKKRADMVVYVPRGAPLSVSTDRDLIDVRSLKSDVRARTVSGDVTARKIDGALDFETGSGDVLVLLEGWDSASRHAFASGSGDLSIYFGGEVNARVRVATSGLISTDFSLSVDYQADRRPIKQGEALLGKGSSTVAISSAFGHVRLVRKPLARKALARPEAGG